MVEAEIKPELLESEAKYRLIVENISDSISILNSKLRFEYVNPSYTKLLGYSRTEILGKFVLEIAHPNDFNTLRSILDKLLSGKSATFQIRLKKKNADFIWTEVTANFFKGKDGKLRLLSVARDITEQKAIQDAIKTKSLDLIFLVDLETLRILEANPSFSHLLQYSPEEFLGLTLYDVIANKPESIDREFHQLLKEQSIFLEGEKYKKKDGTLVDIEIRASLTTFDGRKVINIISKDITIQKMLEWRLEESQKRYRNIVENVKDGVIIIGVDGKFQFISPQIYDMMGGLDIGPDLNSARRFIHKNDFGPLMDAFKQAVKMKAVEEFREVEFRVLHKDGYYKWLASSSKPQTDKKGNLIAFIVVFRDITDRVETELKLRESEEKYRYLFEQSPNSIILMDRNGTVKDCNSLTVKYYGFKKEDLIGLEFGEVSKLLVEKSKNKRVGKILEPMELLLHKKDGSVLWVNLEASFVKVGDELLIQAMTQDISERKIIESKIIESEKKYRLISENANDLIAILRPHILRVWRIPKYKFEYINEETHLRLLGYSPYDLIGKSLMDILYPDDFNQYFQALIKVYRTGEGVFEARVLRKDGSTIWLEIKGRRFRASDGQERILVTSRDISERKEAEQRLKESEQELSEKRKLAAIGQLAAGVAHELNTPLANINLTVEYFLKLLEKQQTSLDLNVIKPDLLDIKKQVGYCSHIVQDLLQFSRKKEMILQKFNLNFLLMDVLNNPTLLSKLKERNINIHFQMNETVDLLGDPSLLSQVFQNLVQNSVDAFVETSTPPEIKLELQLIGNTVQVCISDNGIGIKEEVLPRLFEPFFTTKEVGKGTGLGLTISRNIVEKHGGTLTIQSTYGKGTTAIITLPVR